MQSIVKIRAAFGVALAQLRHYRVRTVLATLAIALAVLSTTLLAGTGVGVLETGTEKFQASQQDLWISGGPARFAPGTVGGIENSIVGSHALASNVSKREDVAVAAPIAYQTVYVGTDRSELRTVVGVGVPNVQGSRIQLEKGPGFDEEDSPHYAGGTYEGPMTREVIVDPRTAATYNLSINDTLYVGGTIAGVQEFRVVGISPTFTRFLGTSTVALKLSELQTLTGTAGTDRASVISVRLEPGTDPRIVERELQETYPEYDVRTNREQLQAFLRERALILASAATLVALAIIAGVALTANILALLVYQQRAQLAALRAGGVSAGTLMVTVGAQAVLLSLLGGGLGLVATPPAVGVLNVIAERIVGFEGLVRMPDWVLLVGGSIAMGIGTIGAVVAGWRVTRISPLEQLRN